MCDTCGCSSHDATLIDLQMPAADGEIHVHSDGTRHSHPHTHSHGHSLVAVEGSSRTVRLEQDILARNTELARLNRQWLQERGIFAVNLMSSPGSGKTTLLERTLPLLLPDRPVTVIEGDQETARDAQRIQRTGCRVVQFNTGGGCHLDAQMVRRGLEALAPAPDSLLFIENVGNLVCPALFDLGEQQRVVVVSVTEGEDKPLKYPQMFRAASLMLLNKVDLLPHIDFDVREFMANARTVNPALEILSVSARCGEGMENWLGWLREHAAAPR
jgi:hydrogenase nickel incorporation protein HypB